MVPDGGRSRRRAEEQQSQFGVVHSFVIPAIAGAFAAALAHPVDLFVVANQTGNKERTLVELRKWPLKTLSRGIWPSLLQAVIVYPFMFGTYDFFRSRGNSVSLSAVAAALPETAVKGPLESLKNLQQMNVPITGRAIAKGTALMGAREGPGNVLYFGIYELARDSLFALEPFAAGVCAGCLSAVWFYPVDAMRAQAVVGVPLTKLRPTFKGCGPYLLRSMWMTGTLFYAVEYMRERNGRTGLQ